MRLSFLPFRAARLARVVALAVVAALCLVLLTPGCGRSSLEVEGFDASIDGPSPGSCGPSTCPGGCCDLTGVCRTGIDTRACGSSGQRCSDCIANGFEFCDGSRQTCGRNVTDCNAECPNGCCSNDPGGSKCLAGTDPDACGQFGGSCTDCTQQGRTCDPQSRECGTGLCDSSNCKGCCVGDTCLGGGDNQACGSFGEFCQSCSVMGQVCGQDPSGRSSCQGTAKCGPANCGGCCNGTTCVAGSDSIACGKQGAACTNCLASGKTCVPLGQPNELTCQTPVLCSPANCAGCCVGNNCVIAPTQAECGKGGEVCKPCLMTESCTAGVCTPPPLCSAANCPGGCCLGNVCVSPGNQNTACGVGGQACLNCQGLGQVCQGGACAAAACGPATCPGGCCSGNTCVVGSQDNACGQGGLACTDCTPGNQVCQGRVCRDKCGPANCTGCCTVANACALGFTNTACGSAGASCVNCVAAASTCDTLGLPRVCANQQNTCPAPFPACPAGITTAVTPSLQGACDDVVDLDPLSAACADSPDDGTCIAAFQVLAAQNAACAACLAPFDIPFDQRSGVYRCAAPFVSAACNHLTGCATDCQDTSCTQCPAGTEDACRAQVNAGAGQCGGFVQAPGCTNVAVLCRPATYGGANNPGTFGKWLRAIGDHFCGNGP